MKKRLVLIICIFLLCICVSGCGKSEEEKLEGYWIPVEKEYANVTNPFPEYLYLFSDGTGECENIAIDWSIENGKFRISAEVGGYMQSSLYDYEVYNYSDNLLKADYRGLRLTDGIESLTYYKQ